MRRCENLREADVIVSAVVRELHDSIQSDAEATVDFVEQQKHRLVLDQPLRLSKASHFVALASFSIRFSDTERKTSDVASICSMTCMPDDKLETEDIGHVRDPFSLADTVGTLEKNGLSGGQILDGFGELSNIHIQISFC